MPIFNWTENPWVDVRKKKVNKGEYKLSSVEDSVNEDRTKHVLILSKGWSENEM